MKNRKQRLIDRFDIQLIKRKKIAFTNDLKAKNMISSSINPEFD